MSKLKYLGYIPLIICFSMVFLSEDPIGILFPIFLSLSIFLIPSYFLIKYQTFWLHTKKSMYLGLPGHWSVLFLFSYFSFYSLLILISSFLIITELTEFSVSINIFLSLLICVALSSLFFRIIHNLATNSNEKSEDDLWSF